MSIFKRKQKEEPKTESKPVIRQAIGYMYNGVLYKTESEAKAAYWVPKLEELVCTWTAYYGAHFDPYKASRNRDEVVALLQEKITVIPLFSEEK